MKNSSVSVIVPAFDAADVLPSSIGSVLRQDYANLEIVIVNDGSADRTREYLSTLKDSRVRILHHQENLGLAASLNDGIRVAAGDFVMVLHADCELLSTDFLRRAAADFADPRIAWVTGCYEMFGVVGGSLFEQIFNALRRQTTEYTSSDVIEVEFAEGKCDMIRRSVLDALGGFPTDTKWSGEDQLLSYEVRSHGYRILRDPTLFVVEHCALRPAWVSLIGNLRKEFVHGKTQAWINFRYLPIIVRDVMTRSSISNRGRHALTKLFFGFSMTALPPTWALQRTDKLLVILAATVIACAAYHIKHVRKNWSRFTIVELAAMGLLGIATSLVYTLGMLWGVVVVGLGAGRLKKPL